LHKTKTDFFVKGNPKAILIVEFAETNPETISEKVKSMESEMRLTNLGYHFPIIKNDDIKKVWDLRKAGLGILNNMPGDAKPVAVIEDTAIKPELLPIILKSLMNIKSTTRTVCIMHISQQENYICAQYLILKTQVMLSFSIHWQKNLPN